MCDNGELEHTRKGTYYLIKYHISDQVIPYEMYEKSIKRTTEIETVKKPR